jgi:hypothetical protein
MMYNNKYMRIGFSGLKKVNWVNNDEDIYTTDFCLDGYFLKDGEVLITCKGAILERIVLTQRVIATPEVVFGGEYHGQVIQNHRVTYSYLKDGEPCFIEFLDETTFARVNEPLGEKAPERLMSIAR